MMLYHWAPASKRHLILHHGIEPFLFSGKLYGSWWCCHKDLLAVVHHLAKHKSLPASAFDCYETHWDCLKRKVYNGRYWRCLDNVPAEVLLVFQRGKS